MVFFNYTTMQMTAKIVYYGPGLCGKTTNLHFIHQKTAGKSRGEMVSLETETDRTLFFDLLPLDVGVIGGMKVRLQLYTVPGQVFYNATRKLVLKGVDGVVFVADSQVAMLDANVESLRNLKANLAELNLTFDTVPIVFQYNKRDIRNIVPIEKLNEVLNPDGHPFFEAAALHGIGVFETLKAVSRQGIASVRKKVAPDAPRVTPVVPAGIESPRAPVAAPPPVEPAARAPDPAAPLDAVPALAGDEPPPVEFAEEDTGKHIVPVRTKGHVDIHQELEKLRTHAAAPGARVGAAARSAGALEVERRLQDMIGGGGAARQDIKRKATVEVPGELLKQSGAVTVSLAFEGQGEGGTVPQALVVRFAPSTRLERLTLHIDLEIKGK